MPPASWYYSDPVPNCSTRGDACECPGTIRRKWRTSPSTAIRTRYSNRMNIEACAKTKKIQNSTGYPP
eukprot:1177484-Prorocentrum_minimum.AAC.4